MHRQQLLEKLNNYQPESPFDQEQKQEVIQFVQTNPDCFKRELSTGHVVGSAWILNQDITKVLLTYHLKLNKWLQLGGHSDGDADTLNVAFREAQEESGLKNIKPFSEEIFDIDVHPYPAKQSKHGFEPEHSHYDIRFAFIADDQEKIQTQIEESKEVRWIPLQDVSKFTKEEAMLRMVRKTAKL